MKKYYHVTLKDNLESIMNYGLVPMLGKLSQMCDEHLHRIYLFNNMNDMEIALQSWLGEAINEEFGENVMCCSLEIVLPDDFPISEGDVEYESYSYITIPSQYIRYLKKE